MLSPRNSGRAPRESAPPPANPIPPVASVQIAPPEVPQATDPSAPPPLSDAVLKVLGDPAVLQALASLPSLLLKLDGALTQVSSLSSRTGALEQSQAILTGRADSTDEALVASVRSKTDLLTRSDVVSKKVDNDLAKLAEQREAAATAEKGRERAEETRKKTGDRIWAEFQRREVRLESWQSVEEEREEGEARRKRAEHETGEKEHQRQLAEESRRQADVARENRTAGMETAEVLRKETETGRVRNEESRREAEIGRQRAEELRSMTDKGRRETPAPRPPPPTRNPESP